MGKDGISKEELAEVVSATVQAVLGVLKGPPVGTPEERFEEYSKQVHPAPNSVPGNPEKLVPCKSPITGSTFVAKIVKSRTYPEGRVTDLLDYVRPAGWDVPKSEGGLFADGVPVRLNGEYSIPFNKWAWEEYWQKDLRAYVGQKFQEHIATPVTV